MGHSEKLIQIAKAIQKVDKLIEFLHQDFELGDREIEPALNYLSLLRMSLESIQIKLQLKSIGR